MTAGMLLKAFMLTVDASHDDKQQTSLARTRFEQSGSDVLKEHKPGKEGNLELIDFKPAALRYSKHCRLPKFLGNFVSLEQKLTSRIVRKLKLQMLSGIITSLLQYDTSKISSPCKCSMDDGSSFIAVLLK